MKCGTLNVNGLRACVRKGLMPWLKASKLDLLCLQEVRMQHHQLDANHKPPKGWHFVQADAEKKGYSGVAIWSKAKPTSHRIKMNFPLADNEGRIVKACFPNIIVWSMYFPSGTSGDARQAEKYRFLDFMSQNAESILKEHENVLICGDVNIAHTSIDIFHDKANAKKSGFLPEEREWMTQFQSFGFIDVFRSLNPDAEEYSWWTNRSKSAREKNVGWRIDYQLASESLASKATQAFIVERSTNLSDHSAVIVDYDI